MIYIVNNRVLDIGGSVDTTVISNGRRNRGGSQDETEFYWGRLSENPISCGATEYGGLHLFLQDCPLGPGKEEKSTAEHARLGSDGLIEVHPESMFPSPPGWEIRVIDNKFPIFDEKDLFTGNEYTSSVQHNGSIQERDAKGKDMLVIMSPYHVTPPHIADYLNILKLEQIMTERELSKPHIQYVHIGRNSAGLPRKRKEKISQNEYYDLADKTYAGASQEHPHERIISMPFVPSMILDSYAKVEDMARNSGNHHLFQKLLEDGKYTIEEGRSFALLADPVAKHSGGLVIVAYNAHNITELEEVDLNELAGMLRMSEELLNVAYNGPPITTYCRQIFNTHAAEFPHYLMNWRFAPRDYQRNGVHATLEEGVSLYVLTIDPVETRDLMMHIKSGSRE